MEIKQDQPYLQQLVAEIERQIRDRELTPEELQWFLEQPPAVRAKFPQIADVQFKRMAETMV